MELYAHLIPARRVIALRDVERVEVLDGAAAVASRHDASRHIARIDATLPEPAECLIEPDAAGDDGVDDGERLLRRARPKEVREGGVDRWRRRLRRRQHDAAGQRESQPQRETATVCRG